MEFEWVKGLPSTQVDAALLEVVPPDLTAPLWLHQRASLLIMQHQPRFMFHIDMGGGKTRTILTQLRARKLKGEKPRAIVFVPYVTATDTWVRETEYTPELSCCALIGSSQENLNTLRTTDHDIYVICYQSAVAMTTIKAPVKGKVKWLLDPQLINEAFAGCDTLVLDELHKCKNIQSLTFKLCRAISKQAKYVYGLTGTPFGRNLEDLWAQFYLIDFGETLGPTIGLYRLAFFSRKEGFWGGFKYNFKKKLMPTLSRLIKNKSIRYRADELSNLEKPLYVPTHLKLPDGIRGYVDNAKALLKQAVSSSQGYEVAGNAYIQLRQLSSGFITFKDDTERVKVKFDETPKLDALCELIEAMPPECKMVVFHEFVFTNEMISDRLKSLKIEHARVWGGQRDQIGQLNKFRTNKNCRVLIINSKSGSSSLNLQFANYLAFFEEPSSAIDRQQAEARVWRSGQTRRVVVYDFFVAGTYDQRMHQANKEGKSLLQLLLDKTEEV